MGYEMVEKLVQENGLSIYKLSKATGIPTSTFSNWKNGKFAPKDDKRKRIAEYFGVPLEYLDTGEMPTEESSAVSIPVYGYVRAGIPLAAIQEILDYEEISPKMAATGTYFALRIKGDSMYPRMSEGDVVIVRQQRDVESGDIAVVLVNGDDATVKKVVKSESGIGLVPINPAYDPLLFTKDEVVSLPVQIVGRVVEIRSKC